MKHRNNPFYARKALITEAKRRATTLTGAARILTKSLNIPFQIAYGVLLQNERTLKRLCASK